VWQSPEGGLYATFVFRVPEDARLTQIPLAAALWVADAVSAGLEIDARLKWPNDVLCRGRKVAGILTEAKTRGEDTTVAIGIGVNILGSAAGLGERATTLETESSGAPSLGEFFQQLCRACDRYLVSPSGARVVDEWLSRSGHAEGDEIRVALDEGGREHCVVGEFAGLTSEGLLRIRTGGSEIVLASGEVQSW
jgi:BirA family biotin operon repressor/biotin-[acetyl-CoA-carboxylase] ligase